MPGRRRTTALSAPMEASKKPEAKDFVWYTSKDPWEDRPEGPDLFGTIEEDPRVDYYRCTPSVQQKHHDARKLSEKVLNVCHEHCVAIVMWGCWCRSADVSPFFECRPGKTCRSLRSLVRRRYPTYQVVALGSWYPHAPRNLSLKRCETCGGTALDFRKK